MPSSDILELTDAGFETDVLNADVPVLVLFWAEWNEPSKMVMSVLDEIANIHRGKLTVGTLNIDDNPATPGKHAVRGIPTLKLFEYGASQATKVGALSKSQLQTFLDANI
jgi:thioredoxin 1